MSTVAVTVTVSARRWRRRRHGVAPDTGGLKTSPTTTYRANRPGAGERRRDTRQGETRQDMDKRQKETRSRQFRLFFSSDVYGTSGYSTTVTPSGNSLISWPEGRMYFRVPSGKSISFSPVLWCRSTCHSRRIRFACQERRNLALGCFRL